MSQIERYILKIIRQGKLVKAGAMLQMPRYAQDLCGGERAVRGKVLLANASYWRGGLLRAAVEIPEHKWPFQTNNMDLWFKEGLQALRNQALSTSWSHFLRANPELGNEAFHYSVNQGRGRLQGREGNQNTFSAEFVDPDTNELVRLDIGIKTVAFAQLWQKRVKAGLQVPKHKQRPDFALLEGRTDPYIRKVDSVLVDPRGPMTFEYSPDEHELFFGENPEWLHKVETLDV